MAGVLDDEDGDVHCLGKKCFSVPHENYKPPTFYNVPLIRGERVPGRVRVMSIIRVILLEISRKVED